MFQKLKEIFAKEELKELQKLKLEVEIHQKKQLELESITKEFNLYKENISKNQDLFDSKENSYKKEIDNLKKEIDSFKQQNLNSLNNDKSIIAGLNEQINKLNDYKETNEKRLQAFENDRTNNQELNNIIENNKLTIQELSAAIENYKIINQDKDNKLKEFENSFQSINIDLNQLKFNEKNYLQQIQDLTENIKKLEYELSELKNKQLTQTQIKKEIKNILVVDDSKIITIQAEKALTQRGFNVKTSISGKSAIEILNNEKIDLVISDVNMPEMNGVELTLWIKQNKPDCPVILMTSFETEEIKKYTLEFNSNLFIEKPINFDYVINKINDINNNLGSVKLKLNDIILMLIISRMNQVINVSKNNNLFGKIYFSLGEIIHSECGESIGLKALNEIMNDDPNDFSNENITDIPNKTITENPIHILLNRIDSDK